MIACRGMVMWRMGGMGESIDAEAWEEEGYYGMR